MPIRRGLRRSFQLVVRSATAPLRAAARADERDGRAEPAGGGGSETDACGRAGSGVTVAPPFEPVDPFGQRLQRGARLAPRQAHERDLEHEARVGGIGAAHVDDRLTEGLERAHEQRRADLLAERGERRLVVVGCVDAHASACAT